MKYKLKNNFSLLSFHHPQILNLVSPSLVPDRTRGSMKPENSPKVRSKNSLPGMHGSYRLHCFKLKGMIWSTALRPKLCVTRSAFWEYRRSMKPVNLPKVRSINSLLGSVTVEAKVALLSYMKGYGLINSFTPHQLSPPPPCITRFMTNLLVYILFLPKLTQVVHIWWHQGVMMTQVHTSMLLIWM